MIKKLITIFMVMVIAIFAVSAETTELDDGKYFIKNEKVPGCTCYTPKAKIGSTLETVFTAIEMNGGNFKAYYSRDGLDPELAALTKKFGVTWMADTTAKLLDIYDAETDSFITLVWME